MEFLGIGPLELLLIILLALIILGPKDMQRVGKSLGQGLNKLVKSDTWRTVRQASEKIRTLPNELMREAELDELKKEFGEPLDKPNQIAPPQQGISNRIAPPPPVKKPTEIPSQETQPQSESKPPEEPHE